MIDFMMKTVDDIVFRTIQFRSTLDITQGIVLIALNQPGDVVAVPHGKMGEIRRVVSSNHDSFVGSAGTDKHRRLPRHSILKYIVHEDIAHTASIIREILI